MFKHFANTKQSHYPWWVTWSGIQWIVMKYDVAGIFMTGNILFPLQSKISSSLSVIATRSLPAVKLGWRHIAYGWLSPANIVKLNTAWYIYFGTWNIRLLCYAAELLNALQCMNIKFWCMLYCLWPLVAWRCRVYIKVWKLHDSQAATKPGNWRCDVEGLDYLSLWCACM